MNVTFGSIKPSEISDNSIIEAEYPLPENYPLIDSYICEASREEDTMHFFRKSFKRPAKLCDENCSCLKEDGIDCPNIKCKIECENHFCMNSQIRHHKELLCWYLDKEKNLSYQSVLAEKLKDGLELTEYHSFGMDFFTVAILYSLLPVKRI